MTMPTVALFDMDGTLIDTGGAGARSWKHAFDKRAARVNLSRADLNRFFVFGGYGSDSNDRAKLTE